MRAQSSPPCSSSSTSTSTTSPAPSSSPSTSPIAKRSPTLLSERIGHRIEIAVPQRGEKRSLVDLAGQNAKQSYIQRFRVLEPSRKAIQEALADALMLPELPRRIECFDISHIQGAETVASMVVWEDGKMNKSRLPQIQSHDRARRRRFRLHARGRHAPLSRACKEEDKPLPSLILIDGGLGQLHAAAEALEALGFTSQPLASIAKKEEVIYLYGKEDEPVVLDRRSPVLHLVQMIRDESHRFAVGYHRQRRAMRDRELRAAQHPRRRPANPPAPAHALRQPARRAAGDAPSHSPPWSRAKPPNPSGGTSTKRKQPQRLKTKV